MLFAMSTADSDATRGNSYLPYVDSWDDVVPDLEDSDHVMEDVFSGITTTTTSSRPVTSVSSDPVFEAWRRSTNWDTVMSEANSNDPSFPRYQALPDVRGQDVPSIEDFLVGNTSEKFEFDVTVGPQQSSRISGDSAEAQKPSKCESKSPACPTKKTAGLTQQRKKPKTSLTTTWSRTSTVASKNSVAVPPPPPSSGADVPPGSPKSFQDLYQQTLCNLKESMKRSRETRKSLHMCVSTQAPAPFPRRSSVSKVLSSIETSSRQLDAYLQQTEHPAPERRDTL